MLSPKDVRLKENQEKEKKKKEEAEKKAVKHVAKDPVDMFFTFNPALGPPYHILIDTNFINFSIQNKLDVMKAAMDCLLGSVRSTSLSV
eukprot:CAMPEP_0175943272 /NCGR_PEP_ID=MMETSP0108-20121206/25456_1 /TAXON_ID=195067 ORGANISM="Goniomonas pacifica, Strain CCMP1869" /NCGR_SAMPLE_ID=MMETSP0108 /ASSEMBLY_ACC=CAM_ASM_000204 /LENGTH=88 /DNA_ID=CAMNT_0017268209 /DNA_START=104 /DNA_END=371 /DNA_ORIENTATION=-